jgi:hypothetical protein
MEFELGRRLDEAERVGVGFTVPAVEVAPSAQSSTPPFFSHIPPIKQPLALEAAAFASGAPGKWAQKEVFSFPTYMLSGIASGVVC